MDSNLATRLALSGAALVLLAGCGSSGSLRRYPLRDALWVDDDVRPYEVDCRPDPKKPKHPICTP